MLKKALLGAGVGIVGLLIVIAMQPAEYHVERSLVVKAPADLVYEHSADYEKWQKWSPWSKLDPNMKTTIEGASGAVGSSYAWSGNDQVGRGKMTITAAEPGAKVTHALEFFEPFESTATTSVLLAKDAGGTKVTWTMDGNNDFMGKAFSLFGDMDGMIGKDYEEGLANLKGIVEPAAQKAQAEALAKAQAAAAAKAAAEAAAKAEAANPEADGKAR